MAEFPVPPDAPLMKAWERYKATESYANSFRWAADEKHRTGSLWAAFSAGFAASFLQSHDAGRERLRQIEEADHA